jgi:hypothetical protein
MTDGGPIVHPAFAGNPLDQTMAGEILEDLRGRFGLHAGQGYLLMVRRRNCQDIPHYIEQAVVPDNSQECPAGSAAFGRAVVPRT